MKALFVMLFAASLAWAANPYTLKTWQPGTKDLTTTTNSVNAWKLMAGSPHCKPKSLVAALGAQFCIQNDGYVYKFNTVTKAWDKQTAMGTPYAITAQNATTLYALVQGSACPSPDYGIRAWTGSAWADRGGCGTQISAGTYLASNDKPALLLAMINHIGQLWYSTDGANTWQLQSGSWLYANAGLTGQECLVDSSHNVWAGTYGNALEELAAIPSENGSTLGCLWAGPPTVVMAWTSSGWTYSMPLENYGTWQVVAGLLSQLIVGTDRYHIFDDDASLNVYHWNINAPSVTVEYGGAWSPDLGCPSPGVHCLATTQHTVKSRLYFASGHGLDGQWRTATNTYNTDIETHPLDTNPQCDPVFGIIDDNECTANFEATDMCDQSHQVVGGEPQTTYVVGDSIDVMDFSYNTGQNSGPMNVGMGAYAGYVLGNIENVVHEDCWAGDPVPVCPGDPGLTIFNRVDWFGGPVQHNEALTLWTKLQNAGISGEDAPYILHSFYWALENPDGSLVDPICYGGWMGNQDFLWGNYDARPHCK